MVKKSQTGRIAPWGRFHQTLFAKRKFAVQFHQLFFTRWAQNESSKLWAFCQMQIAKRRSTFVIRKLLRRKKLLICVHKKVGKKCWWNRPLVFKKLCERQNILRNRKQSSKNSFSQSNKRYWKKEKTIVSRGFVESCFFFFFIT